MAADDTIREALRCLAANTYNGETLRTTALALLDLHVLVPRETVEGLERLTVLNGWGDIGDVLRACLGAAEDTRA